MNDFVSTHAKNHLSSKVELSLLKGSRKSVYIEFISAMDDNCVEIKRLDKISKKVVKDNRPYKGFNFFSKEDQELFETISSGEFNIRGFQNKNLRSNLKNYSSSKISRIINTDFRQVFNSGNSTLIKVSTHNGVSYHPTRVWNMTFGRYHSI